MGCKNSKQKRCKNCDLPYSPLRRSHSVDAMAIAKYRALEMDRIQHNVVIIGGDDRVNGVMGLKIETKTWSNIIDNKLRKPEPKTPVRTPPGEPETINAWELMAGLEEPKAVFETVDSNFQQKQNVASFQSEAESDDEDDWHQDGFFDPQIIAMFRKSLQDRIKMDSVSKQSDKCGGRNYTGTFSFHMVIVYFTSLRGVRKTYEDCCQVRVVLKGVGVRVDERDVSMHSGFKEELRELGFSGLPQVFIGSKHIGGAEEIRQMHEDGRLESTFEGCEMASHIDGCNGCGDIRFVLCETCYGSCKVYHDRHSDYDQEEGSEENAEFGFQRCLDCNENGLIRCPICCY